MDKKFVIFAVDTNIPHDKSKVCLDWEYEQDECPKDDPLLILNKDGTFKPNEKWCPRCLMFTHMGLSMYPGVREHIDFNYKWYSEYSSRWHFSRILGGNKHTDLCNRFDENHRYIEITSMFLNNLKNELKDRGQVFRPKDVKALEESNRVIEFCEKWIGQPGIVIISAGA